MSKFQTKGIYSNGMVLQQNTETCIFGTGSAVTLLFRGNTITATADKDGNWKIEYNPGSAGGPFPMEITCCGEKITFTEVYVGEVWVSSGQSNAQLQMTRLRYSYPEEMKLPANSNIRMITVPIKYNLEGEQDSVENPQWIGASPETIEGMSGTAYFFAKKLQSELGVPVGIINASQGGSPITSWMSKEALQELKMTEYTDRIEKWSKPGAIEAHRAEVAAAQSKWDSEFNSIEKGTLENWEKIDFEKIKEDKDWQTCTIPADFEDFGRDAGVIWLKKEIELTAAQAEQFNSKYTQLRMGVIQDSDKIWVNGNFVGSTGYTYPPRRYTVPAGTLKAGKNTITIRVQKNGAGQIRFYKEKPYCIFTEDYYVAPSVCRNVEKKPAEGGTGIKIDLSGEWKKKQSCTKSPRPGEMFFEWEPSALYNSMLAPAFNYAVAGAIWYQGESNAGLWKDYKAQLVKMIELWREKFVYAKKNMPMVVLQLPNWADGYKEPEKQNFGSWPELRNAQKTAVDETENTGLAVLIDAGEWNDLHPEKKLTGGTRAAMEALRIAYNKPYNKAPFAECCETNGKIYTIRFNCGNSVLKAYKCAEETADFTKETNTVCGFEFLLEDGRVIPAEGKLVSSKDVEVSAAEKNVKFVELRYLWNNNPLKINLYSAEQLPATPFRIKL
ncbi:MAG: hypothetical protein MJ162_04345 [Treponema sp.]|nr:hypothetical protein [Treponema sp.]